MRKTIAAVALGATVLAPTLGSAQEVEITAEIGWVSEYYYRGIPQATSSASAGIELETAGFYLGTWAADVGEGAEVDLYGGYLLEIEDFWVGVGGTGYFYTGSFDDTYLEGNLFAGYGPIEAELSIGQREAFDAPSENYTFVRVTAEHEGFYVSGGVFGRDFSGNYSEAGYGFSVADVDVTFSWIWSNADLSGRGADDHTLVLGASKSFTLFGG